MKTVAILLASLAAAPAAAQTGAPPATSQSATPPTAAAPAEAIEPARMEAARAAIDRLWPLGTYERITRGSMGRMSDAMMASSLDMKMGALPGMPAHAAGEGAGPEANMTMREMMTKSDPHFIERMQITNRVMMEEMVPILARIEPKVREALALAYARRFTTEQLGDMTRFFATPSGTAFAREWMTVMTDKEMMGAMMSIGPEMVSSMSQIGEKIEAATAHLPPPKGTPPPPPPRRKR